MQLLAAAWVNYEGEIAWLAVKPGEMRSIHASLHLSDTA
jgi:hypothetical protein